MIIKKELNNLPNFIEYLKLPFNYDKKILNIPKQIKQITCNKKYKYINDFANYKVVNYAIFKYLTGWN